MTFYLFYLCSSELDGDQVPHVDGLKYRQQLASVPARNQPTIDGRAKRIKLVSTESRTSIFWIVVFIWKSARTVFPHNVLHGRALHDDILFSLLAIEDIQTHSMANASMIGKMFTHTPLLCLPLLVPKTSDTGRFARKKRLVNSVPYAEKPLCSTCRLRYAEWCAIHIRSDITQVHILKRNERGFYRARRSLYRFRRLCKESKTLDTFFVCIQTIDYYFYQIAVFYPLLLETVCRWSNRNCRTTIWMTNSHLNEKIAVGHSGDSSWTTKPALGSPEEAYLKPPPPPSEYSGLNEHSI